MNEDCSTDDSNSSSLPDFSFACYNNNNTSINNSIVNQSIAAASLSPKVFIQINFKKTHFLNWI